MPKGRTVRCVLRDCPSQARMRNKRAGERLDCFEGMVIISLLGSADMNWHRVVYEVIVDPAMFRIKALICRNSWWGFIHEQTWNVESDFVFRNITGFWPLLL